MDYLAHKNLRSAAAQTDAAASCFVSAHAKAQASLDAGGPDFRDRIRDLKERAENLARDMYEAAGPVEAHGAMAAAARGERTCSDPNCPIHGGGLAQKVEVVPTRCDEQSGQYLHVLTVAHSECSTGPKE